MACPLAAACAPWHVHRHTHIHVMPTLQEISITTGLETSVSGSKQLCGRYSLCPSKKKKKSKKFHKKSVHVLNSEQCSPCHLSCDKKIKGEKHLEQKTAPSNGKGRRSQCSVPCLHSNRWAVKTFGVCLNSHTSNVEKRFGCSRESNWPFPVKISWLPTIEYSLTD